ncbi:Cytochrome c [Paracoccus solventivorans]|uniref:Cytochrome c n=1 Tax=Paracoccus solventivorans TaxID=53463 RepID=A0A1M7JYL3_9RHOB|nr:cytochrome c [Paracoccus solventivorans]SHM58088.1 Cytochrome c [Paracoccus solventivorans]
MRTVLVAVIAAIATGGAWWLWGQSDDAGRPAEEGQALAVVTMPATLSPEAEVGQQAFAVNCASCHGTNAEGRAGTAPPLIHKIYEPGHHSDMAFVLAARNGVRAHHWPFGNMAPVPGLTDADLGGIIRFVREVQVANGIR